MSRRQSSVLPVWFWFIPAFLLSSVVVLLWQRGKLRSLPALPALRRRALRPRYTEPDSIPIDLRVAPEFILPPEPPEPAAETADAAQAADAAPPETGTAPAPDDLKVIEGIGPAIARLLGEQGIATFRALAETPVERLDEILRAANLRRLADPGTWPEQAGYAAAGDWDGLKQFQATLKGGRRVG